MVKELYFKRVEEKVGKELEEASRCMIIMDKGDTYFADDVSLESGFVRFRPRLWKVQDQHLRPEEDRPVIFPESRIRLILCE